MRFRYSLLALAAVLLALPASAQTDYGVITQAQLDANTGLTDAAPRCIIFMEGSGVFYDDTSGDVVIYDPTDGGDPGTLISMSDIDAAAGFAVDRCLDIDFDEDLGIYFVFANNNDEAVLRFNGDGDTVSRLVAPAQAAGTYGIAVSENGVYLAGVAFRGASEDGIYRVNDGGTDQTPTVVVQNAALDLLGIDTTDDGDLFAVSSEFGMGDYQNAIVRVTDLDGTPALSIVAQPCVGDSPTFVDCGDGGIEELQVVKANNMSYLLVSNNSFTDVVVGAFDLDGSNPRIVFRESDLIADSDVSETDYTVAFAAYMYYDAEADALYMAGRDFGSSDGDAEAVYVATGLFATADEREVIASGMEIRVPNPLAGSATVRYAVGAAGPARLEAFDLLGRRVALVAEGVVSGDVQTATLDATALPAGLYVLRLTGQAGVVTRTVSVVR